MAEYIGNKKFADMKAKDRRYINGNAEEISSLAEKLTSENIEFSGRITEGRCAITIDNEEAYRKALEYIYEIRTQKTQNSIIGNTSFKFFSRNNRYIANEKSEIMNSVRQILDANKIKYSGVVLGDTTKITVFGENKDYLNSLIEEAKNPEVLKQIEKMNFSVEKKTDGTYLIKNDILNTEKEFISLSEIKSDFDNKDAFLFPTAYRIGMLSDAYDDIYGIYAYNPNTSEEYEILSDSDDWILTFGKVDDALDYAESRNITLDNSFIELKEWRKNDEVALVEENIRKAKEFIDNIDADEDHFVFEEDKIRFTYYNPEGNNEHGQFVEILIFKEDIEEAFRYSFANKNDGFFDYLFTNCSTHLIDAGTEAFIDYAKDFVDKSMSDEPNIYVGNIIDDIDGATNRLLEFIDADEIRKEMSKTSEETELNYELSIFDKIQSEYNEFLEEVRTYDIDKVISMSDEVSSKKEIYEYLQSNTDFFAEEQYDALVNAENTLDAIYNIRIREKCDVRTAIETSANNILDKNDKNIDKSKSLVVNIYGGPGIGKSTSALQIVAELKKMGYSAEYVSEVAKEYVYAKNYEILDGKLENQKKLMREQQSRLDLLIGNVDIVITDSPLLLNGVYLNEEAEITDKHLDDIFSVYSEYSNYDIVLERDLSSEFETEGRIHTLEQSIQKDAEITSLLDECDIKYSTYKRDDIISIVDSIVSNLEELNLNEEYSFLPPDVTVTVQQMSRYGYQKRDIMFPLSVEMAKELYNQNVEICKLYSNNTEDVIKSIDELDDNVMFGIRKKVWNQHCFVSSSEYTELINDIIDDEEVKSAFDDKNTFCSIVRKKVTEYAEAEETSIADYLNDMKNKYSDIYAHLQDIVIDSATEQLQIIAELEQNAEDKLNDDFNIDTLISISNEISEKEKIFAKLVENKDFDTADRFLKEIQELSDKYDNIKTEIQAESINDDDIQRLRNIQPLRKSVQNMLENEVSQTPKFEKLLNDELGEKSPYEMRNGNNAWRNDETKLVPIIEIEKRNIPKNVAELRKKEYIKNMERNTFINRDTCVEIVFGKKSIEEIISKAIPDDKRDIPIEARMSALYQMQELIENAVCFDSQISDYDPVSSKNKSPNSIFIHRMHGILEYEGEKYLANLSVEESYAMDKGDNFKGTSNRLYSFRDIKITPIEAHRIFSPAVNNKNVAEDTSIGVTVITIPQLYELVKTYDKSFFENSNAIGRSDRENEIVAKNEYKKAVEKLKEYTEKENAVQNEELSTDEATFEIYQIYEGEKYRDIRFASYDMLESMNETFDRNNYQKVYTGKLSDIHYDNKLKGIYLEFNANHPNDYEGRSVSVSDVIVIKDKNGEKAYYVDSFGYKEIPDFLIEKEVSPLGTEVPEEDSNEEIIDRETIFKSLINAEGIDLVDKLSNMYESEISEACYNKCNEPEVFKQIENKVLELMQNENEPFSNPYYYEGLADEYDAPDEREKISGEIYNCDLLYMTAIADVLELERPKTSADFIYLNDEKVVEEMSPVGTEIQSNENLVAEKEVKIHNYSDRDNISFFDFTYQKTLQEATNQSPVGTKTPDDTKEEKHDFVITDENLGEGGAKTKFKANVEAIKLLNKIEAENRLATPEEQEILSRYVGWGGLAQAFDENNDKWENEFKELKELLSPEEYSNARASTINAFYTSPTVINAIYEGLEKIGFKGGKILEPAMGVGNFFGSMPKEIRDNSSLSGVELDSISGRIAKQLYQNADITVSGYEKTNFADNSFDVVVGNVPFGDYKVYDKDYNKYNFNIHDYFFAKSLDKVHPGGIVAFVTSQGTMDKKSSEIRQYIAERSELLGAIRLPNDAFKSNAGTEVTSDILFLKKRERPIAVDEHSEEWLGRTFIDENIPVNNYFAKNPDMILGTMVQGNKMYGGEKSNSTMCIPKENSDLKEELKKAINNLQGEYVANTKSYEEKSSSDEVVYATPDIKRYSYAIINDELYYRADGNTMKKVEMPKKNEEICKSMIELRKIATELLDLQVHNINYSFEDEITTKRQELNEKYDKFVSNYGLINSKTNAKIFGDDSGYHLLKSLEVKVKDEEKELYKSEYKKADIFTKNTINPISLIEKVDNSNDALLLSLAEKLEVDFEYMSKISDIPEEQLIEELSSSGLIFQNPDNDMKWESADEYLTGNIREKLDIARNSGLEQNIIALEKVLPPDIEAQDISVKLGAYWIPEKYIKDFIIDTFNPEYQYGLAVIHEPHSDTWSVEGYEASYNVLVHETYGFRDGRNNGYKLIEMALNNQQPKVYKDKLDENGNVVLDVKGKAIRELDAQNTAILQAKQDTLIKKFSEWIMDEPGRRADIVERYNRIFNSVRLREYDGSHLKFVGMSSEIILKPHQKNAVARALQGGNTLLAHEVGAGKTYEMIAIAMEGKRLGLHNKSLCAVPKHLTEQMGNAFRELYPNCNILVATEKDFSTKNRKDMLAKIATGDWDAVIVGHSQFDRMRMSPEREKRYIEEELAELRLALEESNDNYGNKSFTVKQIEKTIKKHEAELLKIEERKNSDDFIDFEQLGIDKLFIDESQNYKNLSVPTKMRNVAGLGGAGSNKSLHLLMKCRYLDEITDHKGIVFASGTPISNSMTEMYSLMRYLQSEKLNEVGLTNFDRWANIFGETTTQMELKPTANGEYQMKTRFAKFNNLPELMTMFKETSDIKTAETLNLPRPECETHNVVVHPNKVQQMFIKELGKRAEAVHEGKVDAHIDNMLKITTDGRKIGLDARCVNSNAPDDPNSKVNVCINNVFDIWKNTSEYKSTQLIFCDISTPHKPENVNTYSIMRKGTDGEYYAVYSDKLKNTDSPDTIYNKLSENPPKDFTDELGALLSSDIIVTRTVDMKNEMAYHSISTCENGIKYIPEEEELWKKLHLSPAQTFESEKRFCVYDDIKEKLITKGVPEKEIAFIHDFEKPEDKQELFEKMNKGEVRIMIGSTSKCGAGMNAQERMIALHHLDAPMRPSDMGQRRGRIERQGNKNPKVDIYKYLTDRTYDAYLYQMLENKQRFISQIMTEKVPVRSCDDIDAVVLEWAEAKALSSGNPLIKEQVDLKARISELHNLKSGYLSQKYKLQDIIAKYPSQKSAAENQIQKIKSDIQRIVPLTEDEEGKKYAPIVIDGKEYTDKEEGANALKEFIEKNRNELFFNNREVKIGEYRGFKISAIASELQTLDTSRAIQICLSGNVKHYCDFKLNTDINPMGNITRLNNALSNISEKELPRATENLNNIENNYIKVQTQIDIPFEHEKELSEKEERLVIVEKELFSNKKISDKLENVLYQRICEIMPQLIECDDVYEKYDMGDDSGYEPLILEKHDNVCTLMHAYVQNGDLMYDPAISFSVDREKQTIELISYELSGLSLYQDFTVEGSEDDRDACAEFMVDWLDNIDAQGYLERENSVEIA